MNIAIILAAGKGTRMDNKGDKILLSLMERPVITYTLEAFEKNPDIDRIVVVANKANEKEVKALIKKEKFTKVEKIVQGGRERQDSVHNGLKAINGKKEDIVVIHNAANPLVSQQTISETITTAKKYGAAVAALPAEDTIKEVENNTVVKTLQREKLWRMQTPQAIRFDIAKEAFEKAQKGKYYATDDVALVERLGKEVRIVPSNKENIKLTTKEDMALAQLFKTSTKVGIGQDSHRFTDKKKPLILGGLVIPNEKGLEADSDGDVLLHALFNALSQAIGEKSLGHYATPMFRNGVTDSKEYLKIALEKIKDHRINNIGFMIEAKRPKIDDYADKMKESISQIMGVHPRQIGITATSGEGLSEFGKGKGIQAFAVVTLVPK